MTNLFKFPSDKMEEVRYKNRILRLYFYLGWKYVMSLLCIIGMVLNAYLLNYAFDKLSEDRENMEIGATNSSTSLVVDFGPVVEPPVSASRRIWTLTVYMTFSREISLTPISLGYSAAPRYLRWWEISSVIRKLLLAAIRS